MSKGQVGHVVVINDRSACVGGASNLAVLSALLLQQNGIRVTYFAGDETPEEDPVAERINLGQSPLVQNNRLSAFAGGLYNAAAYKALRGFIEVKDTPSTIYHLHGWSKILSPSIFRALAPVRNRTILHAHDYFLACPNGGFANYRSHQVCTLKPMSLRCLTTQCDKRGYDQKIWRTARHLLRESFYSTHEKPAHIVMVHERMRDYFSRAGLNDGYLTTIRNPVKPFLTSPIHPWRNDLFFFIGRLEPEKGFDEAARAARIAKAPLHIIGDGQGRSILENVYPEVVLHGWQERQQLSRTVRQARALVVSSRVPEPFGLAALEAVSSGIPVIMPDSALLGMELAERGCGITFRAGDIESFADTLQLMANDDELVREMSARCLKAASSLAHTELSWGHALLDLYERVLERAESAALN